MDANVTVDVGQNITELIGKLAAQIGTTADKVFPWYVNQSVLEGWGTLAVLATVLVLAVTLVCFGLIKQDLDDPDWRIFLAVFGGVALFFWIIIACSSIPDSVTKIANPEYHAMKMLVSDISKLTN
jgi:hypothetical protein